MDLSIITNDLFNSSNFYNFEHLKISCIYFSSYLTLPSLIVYIILFKKKRNFLR